MKNGPKEADGADDSGPLVGSGNIKVFMILKWV